MKFRPAVIIMIIGIVAFIIGISLISVGASAELPVNESRTQERQGNLSAKSTDGTMIGAGIGVTVFGLGLTVAGGLSAWHKRA